MKKLLLSFVLLFSSLLVFAGDVQLVILKPTPTSSTIKRPRSGNIIPKAEVDVNTCQLTISMVASESYTVYVCDSRGTVVYQGSVATDGGRHVCFLPELEADLYSISIEGNSATYDGEFYAN